jgi:two-component SAPR family response regulator
MSKLSILIADGDAASVSLLKTNLNNRYGDLVELSSVENGEKVISSYFKKNIDVLFVEVMLPIFDGLFLSERINEISGVMNKNVFVCAYTGVDLDQEQQKLFNAVFMKPLNEEKLYSFVDGILDTKNKLEYNFQE